MSIHHQTRGERDLWKAEFSDKVRDGILAKFDDTSDVLRMLAAIETL